METKYKTHRILDVVLLVIVLAGIFAGNSRADEDTEYLKAVREFADNVLKYGKDVYGPKHTPLFVDGLNIHTHEPVKWIAPNGDRWILSNLASQQNLFRTLDGLTKITGDPKYRQAAVEAIKYAFENLRSPNGLLYWGKSTAYDAHGDNVCGTNLHEFKSIYPYYELMWSVNPEVTGQFIESLWASHILDWSNLDMNRIGPLDRPSVPKGWDHEYKGGPVPFESKLTWGVSFSSTGSDLYYAAALLFKLSGQKKPLNWAKRLAHRYVEARDPKTGVGSYIYTLPKNALEHPLADDFKGHTVHTGTLFLMPDWSDPLFRRCKLGYFTFSPGTVGIARLSPFMCQLVLGEILGAAGKEFQKWGLEELTAWGKIAYRKEDNSWIPMLTDGTSLEGYVLKRDTNEGLKGTVFKTWKAGPTDFWTYALAFRITGDGFMWQMARNVGRGNGFGDIGAESQEEPQLNIGTDYSNPHALLGFLALYEKTRKRPFLDMAKRIGDNILAERFHKGFFAPSEKHIYAKLEAVESLVLLHVHAALRPDCPELPLVWPGRPYFWGPYRGKDVALDNDIIYTLTESPEPPISLNEAAAMGNLDLVKSLIANGADVNNREDTTFKTPLQRAVISGHKQVAELLLAHGADINAGKTSSLHYAAKEGHKEIAGLLIANGADVNAKNNNGQTPLDIAVTNNRKDIIDLLVEKGAVPSSIHMAARVGVLARVKALLGQGADVNAQDDEGTTPLHYAVQEGHKELTEFLIAKGADINAKNNNGQTPLDIASSWNRRDVVELLLAKGATISSIHIAVQIGDLAMVKAFLEEGTDVNAKDGSGYTPFHYAIWYSKTDIARLLIEKGADIHAKDQSGYTPLHWAVLMGNKELTELILAKGADVNARGKAGETPLDFAMFFGKAIGQLLVEKGAEASSLQSAAFTGDLAKVRTFLDKGVNVDEKKFTGVTALHAAASGGRKEVAEFLIVKGADINASARNGETPLHWAARAGSGEVVELLISKGADVNAKDKRDRTPLDIAVDQGHTEIVELLHKHGAKE